MFLSALFDVRQPVSVIFTEKLIAVPKVSLGSV